MPALYMDAASAAGPGARARAHADPEAPGLPYGLGFTV